MTAIGVIILILAAALLIIGGMAAARKLPGNNIIGLRVEEARKSQEIWELSHAVAGPVWMVGGVALIFGGTVALGAQGWMWIIPVLAVIASVLAISIGANLGARAAHLADKAAKEADKPTVNINALRQAAQSADQKDS
ncbi:membrane protein [Corynebacterium phocae]|uniref:Membrane protein n=1 Tax=Corynebacterium phocae TaxID=161895 RepID=A0A1L7D5Z6_9CORY|nr:SdpI family protein [Corynebacterium phocae]APT93540.1 membrane protein [Corynebacterium phocae]KAA8720626.1 SdpI family protein [Corynebacterium phocae]